MKHTLYIILALPFLTLAISSCDGKLDDLIEDDKYSISKEAQYATFENMADSFELESSSSSETLNIKSTNTYWKLSSNASWIHFDKSSGNGDQSVVCSFDKNPYAYKKRRGKITLSTDRSSISTMAIQEASFPYLNFNVSGIDMSAAGGTTTVDVSSNCTNITIANHPDFAEVNYYNGKLTVTVSPNTTGYRSGNIELSYDYMSNYNDKMTNDTKTISVYQESPSVTVNISDKYMDAEGGQISFSVTSDLPWRANITDDWLKLNPQEGNSGTTNVNLYVSPNSTNMYRRGDIEFYVGTNILKTISIYQYSK